MGNVGKSKVHGSAGSMPKPGKGPHCHFKKVVGPATAPNNPDKPQSGKGKKYEGGEAKLQGNYNPSKQNYAEQPKHLKQ